MKVNYTAVQNRAAISWFRVFGFRAKIGTSATCLVAYNLRYGFLTRAITFFNVGFARKDGILIERSV